MMVEVVTTDPVLGVPTTNVLTTLMTKATTANTPTTMTTTPATTTIPPPDNQQGPVGQPAATTVTPGGPTPFTYTTIINGETVVSTDVFTPTNPATTPVVPSISGTVWDLSSWLHEYGPTTPVGSKSSAVNLKASTLSFVAVYVVSLMYILSEYLLVP
ncbi:hypothetical protein AX17_002378 [Amanita inopinata Kibby_2008]|nr:hypothetical protein AX17_002378 [Amanita inopinata Kibby_2008]